MDVLTSQPSYKPDANIGKRARSEVVDDVKVHRLPLPSDRRGKVQKLINTGLFPLLVFLRVAFGRKYDVIMCSTAPPVLLGFAVAAAARMRGSQFIYHCMDLHPEIGALSGEFANPLIYRALLRLDIWTCRQASSVVVLSEDMLNVLVERDHDIADRVQIINNFDLPDYADSSELSLERAAGEADVDRIRVVFAGNLGRFQGLQDIVRAAGRLDDRRSGSLEIIFMGDGIAKEELMALAAEAEASRPSLRIRFLPHGSPAQARALMRTADYGLVPLIPEVIRYAYPSKVATYLSENLPVIAVVEPDSELARMVSGERIGFVAAPGDTAGLTQVLDDTITAKDELPSIRGQVTAVASGRFSRTAILERWDGLLSQSHQRT